MTTENRNEEALSPDAGSESEFHALLLSLEDSIERFPGIATHVRKHLHGNGNFLLFGLVNFTPAPAGATGEPPVVMEITDKFRSLVAAAATGDLKEFCID
ncbi:hypothetical protein ACIQVE_07185 [Pseudomonas sp. NPDC098747]|uniref:hypothetical protein n=1 Tax=Pseudomonas sp. NPDC098747 TaxID=3364487 RepID=UPI00383BAAB5